MKPIIIQLVVILLFLTISCDNHKNKAQVTSDQHIEMLSMLDSLIGYEQNRYDSLTKKGITDQWHLKDSAMEKFNDYITDPYGYRLEEYRNNLKVVRNMNDQEFLLYYQYKLLSIPFEE